jgi:hypothetical protein
MNIRVSILVAIIAVSASPTSAQSVPTKIDMLVLPAVGDPATVAPVASLISNLPVFCNRVATADAVVPLVNPVAAEVDDPFVASRVCRVPIPDRFAIPPGNYRVVAVFISARCAVAGVPQTECRGPRSAVGDPVFELLPEGPPVAPTNLKPKR